MREGGGWGEEGGREDAEGRSSAEPLVVTAQELRCVSLIAAEPVAAHREDGLLARSPPSHNDARMCIFEEAIQKQKKHSRCLPVKKKKQQQQKKAMVRYCQVSP